MHYPDLSNECEVARGPNVRAVGWLSAEFKYGVGPTQPDVFERLKQLVANTFEPVTACGVHTCDLCQFDGEKGARNLFVPGNGCIYVCPELVVHYIGTHGYQPPSEFAEAVLACPDPSSREYKVAFLANGGREMMRGAV